MRSSPMPALICFAAALLAGCSEPSEDARMLRACRADPGQGLNREALEVSVSRSSFGCPRLGQYHLFTDPDDPGSLPRGRGVPFVLTSRLFADYAVKYRVAWLPPGESAEYRSGREHGPNRTFAMPVGTVLTKSFSFPTAGEGEDIVETRVLVKRRVDGEARWAGLPYRWRTEDGERVARLQRIGSRESVSWRYEKATNGALVAGSTDSYRIPSTTECRTCHGNGDRPAGAPPLALKPRLLNRPFEPEYGSDEAPVPDGLAGRNQLRYWRREGLLTGGPERLAVDEKTQIAENVPRLPIPFVGPDGEPLRSRADFAALTDDALQRRARAYLEGNCSQCHNPRGRARQSRLFLDSLREPGLHSGICKEPVARGQGTGGLDYDIVPGDHEASIIWMRIDSVDIVKKMPILERSVRHERGSDLIAAWIDSLEGGCEEPFGRFPTPGDKLPSD